MPNWLEFQFGGKIPAVAAQFRQNKISDLDHHSDKSNFSKKPSTLAPAPEQYKPSSLGSTTPYSTRVLRVTEKTQTKTNSQHPAICDAFANEDWGNVE